MPVLSVFVWGAFGDSESAQRAVDQVIEARFPPEEISVLSRSDRGPVESRPPRHKTAAPIGAIAGAILGAIAMVAVLSVPNGFDGPTSDLVRLGLTGAITGAMAGAFAGLYVWRREADVGDEAFAHGEVVVGVTVPDERLEDARRSVERARPLHSGVSRKPPPR